MSFRSRSTAPGSPCGRCVPPTGLSFARLSARQARMKSAFRMTVFRSPGLLSASYEQSRVIRSASHMRRRQRSAAHFPALSVTIAASATRTGS